VLNEGEIVLDEAHVVAFAAATEIAFSMDEVRNAPHHQDRKWVPNVRDFDVNRVQPMPKYCGHGSSFVFPYLTPKIIGYHSYCDGSAIELGDIPRQLGTPFVLWEK
jgi:hypothetical protein